MLKLMWTLFVAVVFFILGILVDDIPGVPQAVLDLTNQVQRAAAQAGTLLPPSSLNCPGILTSTLRPGSSAIVTELGDNLRQRDEPSTNGAIIGELQSGTILTALEETRCSGQYMWRQFRLNNEDFWAVEATATERWVDTIEPLQETSVPTQNQSNTIEYCTNAPTPMLVPGEQAEMVDNGRQNRMRSSPGTGEENTILDQRIPFQALVQVIEGPVCRDGYWWWKVTYNNTTGWTAEGERSNYWFEPVSG